MICVSALYPNTRGSRFDETYYTTRHTEFAARLLTPHGLLALRIAVGLHDLAGGPPAFWAVSEMHFSSREAFDEAIEQCGAALFEDAKNYTDVNPVLQVSRLLPGATGPNL